MKWIDMNRKVLIDCLLEHSDGRYSNIKNKKSAWKLVVADFAIRTGLSYDKKILASQVQSPKKTGQYLISVRLNTRCHLLAFAAKVEKQLQATVSIQ